LNDAPGHVRPQEWRDMLAATVRPPVRFEAALDENRRRASTSTVSQALEIITIQAQLMNQHWIETVFQKRTCLKYIPGSSLSAAAPGNESSK
jgi:hypothetical protein